MAENDLSEKGTKIKEKLSGRIILMVEHLIHAVLPFCLLMLEKIRHLPKYLLVR